MLSQRLIDILIMNDSRQHVSEPTHRIVDYIGHQSSVIISLPTITDLGVSDHFVVQPVMNAAGVAHPLLSSVAVISKAATLVRVSQAARLTNVAAFEI